MQRGDYQEISPESLIAHRTSNAKAYFVKIYFILGLAMCCVVLWDENLLPITAKWLVKPPGGRTGFARIVLAVRNLTLMTLVSFFLWPLVVLIELSGRSKR